MMSFGLLRALTYIYRFQWDEHISEADSMTNSP